VNEEALAHWGAVIPKTNKQTNKQTWKNIKRALESKV
jgi:hypothetical protein